MTDANVVSKICRFFFLALLDEKAALNSSSRAFAAWKVETSKSRTLSVYGPLSLVRLLSRNWTSLKMHNASGQPLVFAEQDWIVPNEVDLGPWMEFRKRGHPDEIFAVLMVYILALPVETVAEALNLSEGTVRYRLNKGMQNLGQIRALPGEAGLE